MKTRLIGLLIILGILAVYIWFGTEVKSNIFKPEVKVTVIATADLHNRNLATVAECIKRERQQDSNLIVLDAGDFFDIGEYHSKMWEWFFTGNRQGIPPLVNDMAAINFDAVLLGNHEFVANDKAGLDALVLGLTNHSMPVLSANTYNASGSNYVKPYIIKKIPSRYGVVKVGILGLTIKEVGERVGPRELRDLPQYKGSLEINDLLLEAQKWIPIIKANGADVIIALVHSGEEPLKPKNPGNRIKELAHNTSGIDAIVAAHTHKNIPQHDYKNAAGSTVIVTQPGSSGKYISKINLVLIRTDGKWRLAEKHSVIKMVR